MTAGEGETKRRGGNDTKLGRLLAFSDQLLRQDTFPELDKVLGNFSARSCSNCAGLGADYT